MLTEAQLTRFLPGLTTAGVWVPALNTAMTAFGITSPPRIAAFLAQIAPESAELRRLVEALSYSANRLQAVWPGRFPSLESARPFERQPEKLANCVYAKRLGNADTPSGDGWRFRGRGLLQITGRGNYRACGTALELPLEGNPERLETPEVAALAAAQFWHSRGLNELADDQNDDNDDTDFVSITIAINGGRVGLAQRRAYWERAKQALGSGGTGRAEGEPGTGDRAPGS
ncbi:MAG: glycoside hydrolase family 19 protein [Gemmatimonadota bacterium]